MKWYDTRKIKPPVGQSIIFACDDNKVYMGYMHSNGWFYDYGREVAVPYEYAGRPGETIAIWWADVPEHHGERT